MDGFTGFKTASTEQLPDAVAVMDPFHVVALAGDALDRCRQRVQQGTCGHRGRTGSDLLTERQQGRLNAVFATEDDLEVEVHLGHLPAHRGRLQRPRSPRRERRTDEDHRYDQ